MSSPSAIRCRGKVASSTPSRQITRCGTERIGSIVHMVSVPVRKFARVARPLNASASRARTSDRASPPAPSAPLAAPSAPLAGGASGRAGSACSASRASSPYA